MEHFFLHSVRYSELIAAITGTVFFYKYKNTSLRYFLYLLWYITLTEFAAWFSFKYAIKALIFFDKNGVGFNWWMYNLLRFITFNTLFFVYYKYLKTSSYKKWIKIFSIVYIIVSIVNWSFIQNFAFSNSELPRIIGSVFLIISVLFYFVELLRSDKIVIFHKLILFWISVGLLLFYTGTIPFFLKINDYALISGIHRLFLIVYILAIIMYLTFTFGFIWSRKE